MNRIVSAAIIALCASIAFADNTAPAPAPAALTPEEKAAKIAERKAHYRAITEKKTGGLVRKSNSAKGMFVVLNAQTMVPETELASIVSTLDTALQVVASVKPATAGVTVDTVKGAIKSAGGTLGVALVESDTLPAFLAAPEDGWVIVNVKPLVKGVAKDVAASRVRKEALRAFGFVAGGIYAARGPILMREVSKPEDLDMIPRERFGIDVMARMSQLAPHFGITPWYQKTYKRACQEGWAPAPTNDNQKAIWNEVHTTPTKPIIIKPETTKQN